MGSWLVRGWVRSSAPIRDPKEPWEFLTVQRKMNVSGEFKHEQKHIAVHNLDECYPLRFDDSDTDSWVSQLRSYDKERMKWLRKMRTSLKIYLLVSTCCRQQICSFEASTHEVGLKLQRPLVHPWSSRRRYSSLCQVIRGTRVVLPLTDKDRASLSLLHRCLRCLSMSHLLNCLIFLYFDNKKL